MYVVQQTSPLMTSAQGGQKTVLLNFQPGNNILSKFCFEFFYFVILIISRWWIFFRYLVILVYISAFFPNYLQFIVFLFQCHKYTVLYVLNTLHKRQT